MASLPLLYPDVQGQRVAHSSLELGILGDKITGVKNVSWKATVEKPKIYGTSRTPIARTGGKVDYEGEIEFYSEEYWYQLLPRIASPGGVGFSELSWTLSLRYFEKLGAATLVLFSGVCFLGPDVSHSEGADAITVKVPLSIMDITINGYRAFSLR